MQRPRSHTGLTAGNTLRSGLLCGLLACSGDPAVPAPAPLPPLPDRVGVQTGLPAGPERPQRELRIVLTGDVRGEIEPCGCPTLPYGGFERRERLLERLWTAAPTFQLDAGELLAKGVNHLRQDRAERARAVLDLSATVGVSAWVPGPSDLLALPLDELRSRSQPPALSATWTDAGGELLFPPALVLEDQGLRVGVIGLSGEPSAPELKALVQARDPVLATREALAALPADLDLVLALGNLGDEQAERVAAQVPGLAAILTTTGGGYDAPRQVRGVPIVETPSRGRYVQLLDLRLGSTPDQPLLLTEDLGDWRSLRSFRQRAHESGQAPPSLAGLEAQLQARATGRNLAFLETRPLAQDLDGEARVSARLQTFKRDVLKEAAERAAAAPPPQTAAYATAAGCINCHVDEFARWSYSDHAQAAWQSLLERQATGDAECLPCHTTGFGEPGGLGEISELNLRRFKAVQCEACHGPMAGHPEDPEITSEPITAESCTGCHDPANSPDFDFATYLPRGSCQPG